jgi:hypothetical protein
MANDPEIDLAAYLNGKTGSQSAVTLAEGTNLFTGPVRPVETGMPAEAVFVLNGGGPPAMPYFSSPISDRQSGVQVRVRSNPGDYAGGSELARDLFALVHEAPLSGYTYVLARQSEPNYLSQDDQGCHEWSINAIARWQG